MRKVMASLLHGLPGDRAQQNMAQCIASLPMRMGSFGLRSASRMAPAAFWASWADALHMIDQRLPRVSRTIAQGCLGVLVRATEILDRDGFVMRPPWEELQGGKRPPSSENAEPGEWQHGWQYHASSTSEFHFRETVVIAQSCAADQVHLRSHSGPCTSAVLHGAPTGLKFKVTPEHFRTLVLERLRWPLQIVEAQCECGALLDVQGRHRAACPRSGRLRSRAVGPERTLARVCREAGATVRCNVHLRDMNVAVSATDMRSIEVLATGLPLHHGAQLAVDITLRTALTSASHACPSAATIDGAVLVKARADKERKYAELVNGDRCRLVVIGVETGGRWSDEVVTFLDHLASARAREAPPILRGSAFFMWRRRWSRMLAVACGRAFAQSLVSAAEGSCGVEGPTPDLADLCGGV